MELNVKQSGIERRVLDIDYMRNKRRKILKRCHELYLRNDIGCCLKSCRTCQPPKKKALIDLCIPISSVVPVNHAVIVDATTIIRFHHVFEHEKFTNIIIPQTVWEEVKRSNPPAYKSMNSWCYEDEKRIFVVFMNGLHYKTYTPKREGEKHEERLERALITCAKHYADHWDGFDIVPILLCATVESKNQLKKSFENTFTLKEYVEGIEDNADLLDKISGYESGANKEKHELFDEHLSLDEIQAGLRSGKYKKGTFQVSRENYLEANVHVDEDTVWFIQGRLHCNRAVNGDTVAVELLPQSEWSCPVKLIKLRDVEEMEKEAEVEKDDEAEDKQEKDSLAGNKKARLEDVCPTAKVVGIIKRNWRPYCGVILRPAVKDTTRVLFAAAERLIPRIRIETRQVDRLIGKRIVVSIDHWARDSRYPHGHYVRTLGTVGDRDVENEVLLLEHDVPHDPFSDSVLACLPSIPWIPPEEPHRKDLRHLTICSVDPPGCTDIDDALHCRKISEEHYEVGVHIADVTHFLRPNTAMDSEAAERGTTVYLCDRRIDMLPELLSSDLCSLREHVDRFAFSVLWVLSKNADIIDVKFTKSLINSSASLTYEDAQKRIDDPSLGDPVTVGLRELLALSKKLKAKRHASGALTLASSEIRFNIDSESMDPISVQEKKMLDTNSMVEEFMLLANISVAERICAEYPDCALLRRHPIPSPDSYKLVVEAARARGFSVNVEGGKALADSLDKAVDNKNPMVNVLLRMLTTRCMTQAVYFSSGSLPPSQYIHFGLAAPIYTHFTSPIRRYADVMVHRLLAAAINADTTFPSMLKCDVVSKIAANLNYRHKQAQYAGRASILLNTLLYFKDRCELLDGYIMGIRKNGLQVFVPKYGFESVLVFPSDSNYIISDASVTAGDTVINAFDKVKVQLSLNDNDVQHIRLDMQLVEPKISGFSVDYVLSAAEGHEGKREESN
ncbi:hypothetical protein AB6A40_001089 [Gnathostoma spinigerum]|uniref:Protein DIS3 homolog n=1 Tax=Gnathostoma spinigerum TaxID=75299 RepID=A0ABD6E4E3_9BILA